MILFICLPFFFIIVPNTLMITERKNVGDSVITNCYFQRYFLIIRPPSLSPQFKPPSYKPLENLISQIDGLLFILNLLIIRKVKLCYLIKSILTILLDKDKGIVIYFFISTLMESHLIFAFHFGHLR